MKSAGKARNNGLYRHIRTSKEIIRNLLNDSENNNDWRIGRHLENLLCINKEGGKSPPAPFKPVFSRSFEIMRMCGRTG